MRKNSETTRHQEASQAALVAKNPPASAETKETVFDPQVKIPGGGRDLKVGKNGSVFNSILLIIGYMYKALNTVDI